ncbi:hypothetical protein RIF29_10574 [Crotalaria pallida]|uniref:Uncharacterized protein n=1 Tax=Crotalaria pallida TaxID=3830 RepID=A0AAN9FT06_CROPI
MVTKAKHDICRTKKKTIGGRSRSPNGEVGWADGDGIICQRCRGLSDPFPSIQSSPLGGLSINNFSFRISASSDPGQVSTLGVLSKDWAKGVEDDF